MFFCVIPIQCLRFPRVPTASEIENTNSNEHNNNSFDSLWVCYLLIPTIFNYLYILFTYSRYLYIPTSIYLMCCVTTKRWNCLVSLWSLGAGYLPTHSGEANRCFHNTNGHHNSTHRHSRSVIIGSLQVSFYPHPFRPNSNPRRHIWLAVNKQAINQ